MTSSYLIETDGETWKISDILNATHRMTENKEFETEDGLPLWDIFDLDGNFVNQMIIPAEHLTMGDEDE